MTILKTAARETTLSDDDGSNFAFTLVMATSSSGQLVRPKTKSKQARKNSTSKNSVRMNNKS